MLLPRFFELRRQSSSFPLNLFGVVGSSSKAGPYGIQLVLPGIREGGRYREAIGCRHRTRAKSGATGRIPSAGRFVRCHISRSSHATYSYKHAHAHHRTHACTASERKKDRSNETFLTNAQQYRRGVLRLEIKRPLLSSFLCRRFRCRATQVDKQRHSPSQTAALHDM